MEKGKRCEGDDENLYQHNSTMLWVRDLDASVTDQELYEHFDQFPGLVVWCEHIKSSRRSYINNLPIGYGYVNYNNRQEAANAVDLLNSTLLKNKPIRVQFSPFHQDSAESILLITNLAKSVDKNTLHDIFSKYGKILSIRVSTDASGHCSGVASVYYNCFESTQTAIEHLNGALIHNKQVCVCPINGHHKKPSPNLICVLFSSHTPATKYDLRSFFFMYGPIASVSETIHHKGDRFGLVTFKNPEDAARAARDAPNHNLFNHNYKLHGNYEDAPDGDQVNYTQLHVNNLDKAITDHSLKALFFPYGSLSSCKVLRDSNGASTGSGIVAFITNKEASRAFRAMNGEMIMGKSLCVTLAKGRRPEMRPVPMTATSSGPPLHLPMHPPACFGLGFGQQMFPPGGFFSGFGQQMFYGQMPPTLFSQQPGYWFQQQLIPGVRLPAGPPMPNTFVPQFLPAIRPGVGASMPNYLCS